MDHVLEAALNLMPQRSTSVQPSLHKVKWQLGQANKLFENEKKETKTNEYQDMILLYYQVSMQASKLALVIRHLSRNFKVLI